jgi:hypothetical protein
MAHDNTQEDAHVTKLDKTMMINENCFGKEYTKPQAQGNYMY